MPLSRFVVVLAASFVLVPPAARAQGSLASEELFFRIDSQLERSGERAAIVGVLANHYLYRLERVQLRAQILDEAGTISHETFGIVDGIPPGGRGSFRIELPVSGARYVVTVYAFEFGPRESP